MISPTRTIIENGHTMMVFEKSCSMTKELFIIKIPEKQYYEWINGGLIQDVMPQLSADEREFLITGTTPAEWNASMGILKKKGKK